MPRDISTQDSVTLKNWDFGEQGMHLILYTKLRAMQGIFLSPDPNCQHSDAKWMF